MNDRKPNLPTRVLGRTGLTVTALGYGASRLGRPELSEDQVGAVLHAVLDAGINFIDTAADYGLSEERIGRHLASRRKDFVLATKSGLTDGDKNLSACTRDHLFRDIERSLQRLRTDHVDILQLHNHSPAAVRAGRMVEALHEVQERGLARFVGVSTEMPDLAEFAASGAFDTFQIAWSAIQPKHREAITVAARAGGGTIIRGSIAWGGPDGRTAGDWIRVLWDRARLTELLGGMRQPELLLRYALAHPDAHTLICGSTNPAHVTELAAASRNGPLGGDLCAEIERRLAAVRDAIRKEKEGSGACRTNP
jgi:aryl-alcohol dehydrogenase-like predicted oxidoreductase